MNLGDQLQLKNLFPVKAITTSDISPAAIDLQQLSGEIAVLLDSGAGGAGATLDCKLTECDTSGGSYTDVVNGAFAQVGNAASVQKVSLNKDELKRYVKLVLTVAGTANFAVSSKIVGINKNPA